MYTRRLQLNLTGQGTAANSIGAKELGFIKLLQATPLYDQSGVKVIPTMVDPVNNILLLGGGASGAPADVTSAVSYITVTGLVA